MGERKAALFICEHKKRDDEDCLRCEIAWEERMIELAEAQLASSKALLAKKLAALAAQEPRA
jgi:hypothetical protein